jgi:hypothetical protein
LLHGSVAEGSSKHSCTGEDVDVPLLPFDHFRIETGLTSDEVRNVLAANVEPRQWLRFGGNRCPWEGEVMTEDFRIRRIIRYRNSFLPLLRGRISATAGGCIVEGTMSLHPVVLGFMIFWLSGVFLLGVGIWVSLLAQHAWQPWALIPLGMFAFGWLLTSGAFTVEARKARALLGEMLASPTTVPRVPSAIS